MTNQRQSARESEPPRPERRPPDEHEGRETFAPRGVREPPPLALHVGHLGNHAVSRLVAARRPGAQGGSAGGRLSRFEAMEHKTMGDRGSGGQTITLTPGLDITFGDMTAMAGDHFSSVDQLQKLAAIPGSPKAPFNKPGTVDEVKYVLYVEVRKSMKADQFDEKVINAAKKRYFNLAAHNESHFSRPDLGDEMLTQTQLAAKGKANNAGSYRGNHELAIEEAVTAGKRGAPLDQALLYEAFGSHFLTDAFASGHTRTPRGAIKDWWDPRVPMFWHNLKLWLAENIAKHLNDNTTIAGAATVNYLWKQAISTLEEVMKEKGMPDLTFGDAISGALHDLDNTEGVKAKVGARAVTLVGDGEVLDDKDRELARGSETLKLAAASVKVSLKDVHDAYAAAKSGKANAAAVKRSLMTRDGLYRAEQLWPQALPNTKVSNPSLNWMVGSVDTLLADPRIQEAITHFAHEKADTLGGEVDLDPPFKLEKQAALKWTLAKLKQDRAGVLAVFQQIINYTPGLATASGPRGEGELTGLFGDTSDDNARAYYRTAKSKKVLHTLTIPQRQRLIRLGLDGSTGDEDEQMILGVLSSNTAHIVPVLNDVGWRRVWEDMDGSEGHQFVKLAAQTYWASQSFARKRSELAWLAGGVTGETAEETIVAILRTCTRAQVNQLDDELDLSWDLDGAEQKALDQMKAGR